MSIEKILWRWYKRIVPRGDSAERGVKSAIWAFTTNLFTRGSSLLRLTLAAIVLGPTAIGTFGVALLIMGVVERISKLGFDASLIHDERTDVNDFLDTVWSLNIARGSILFVLLIGSSAYIGEIIGEPTAVPIIRAIGGVAIIRGLLNPGAIYFRKELAFDRESLLKLAEPVANTTVTLVALYLDPTIWALVYGLFAGTILRVLVSYLLHPYRPSLAFNWERAKELYSYGKWVTASGILEVLYLNLDDIVVATTLGSTVFGYYQTAYRFANAPTTQIDNVITQVTLPLFAQLQNQPKDLRVAFIRVFRLVTTIAVPMGVGIVLVAESFVTGILGSNWSAMVILLQIIAIWGTVRALAGTTGPLFKAIGVPKYTTILQFINVVVISITVVPAAMKYEAPGVAVAVVASTFLSAIGGIAIAVQVVDASIRDIFFGVFPPVLASSGMGGGVLAFQNYVAEPVVSFIGSVLLGVIIYTGIMSILIWFGSPIGEDIKAVAHRI